MNYQITEEEIQRVESARAQLRMVCGLLTAVGSKADADTPCGPEDLYEFICAQVDTLSAVLDATKQRWKIAIKGSPDGDD
ncbi:MAG: hypothetical protein Q8S02_11680 [Hydrogenophaga sp.]|nr:hypothetical protein [Hydrogenophaga sp.]